jgi:hypothetical protein
MDGKELEFSALNCIDPVSNLVEISQIQNKTVTHVGMIFKNNWLAHYPKPEQCVHDNGSNIIDTDFQQILELNGVHNVPTTVKNPQLNAICEQMHQSAGNTLHTLTLSQPPQNLDQAQNHVDSALATTMHAMRCAMHHALHISPGTFVFKRDMFLNIPIIANLQTI